MVDGETDDHNMVPIAVYAAEGRIYVTVARGRDAIDSGSRVDVEITNFVNLGGWALRELCFDFRLHCRLSYRLSTFGVSKKDSDNCCSSSLSTVFWAYRSEMLFVSISNTASNWW